MLLSLSPSFTFTLIVLGSVVPALPLTLLYLTDRSTVSYSASVPVPVICKVPVAALNVPVMLAVKVAVSLSSAGL